MADRRPGSSFAGRIPGVRGVGAVPPKLGDDTREVRIGDVVMDCNGMHGIPRKRRVTGITTFDPQTGAACSVSGVTWTEVRSARRPALFDLEGGVASFAYQIVAVPDDE